MRAVFVNQCHPEMPHVCAVRLREFAAAMARRGHRVVLLTETLGPGDAPSPEPLRARIKAHDWRTPLHVDCPRAPAPMLQRLHDGTLPLPMRKAVVAASFVFRGGVFAHWSQATRHTVALLAGEFRPDIVWGTFGCTDAWNVAKQTAAISGCPWIADIKDNWEVFIPLGLRALMARRYSGAARFTALSAGHAEIAMKRFGTTATVVHSGFPAGEVGHSDPDGEADAFRIVSGGSIYDGDTFAALIRGIRDWLTAGGAGKPVEFCYAGNEHKQVAALAAPLRGRCQVTIRPLLPPAEFRSMLSTATVLVYARQERMLYHQKFIEYLSTGRPVLCFPGEKEEIRNLARTVNAPFFSCQTTDDVTAALSAIEAGDTPVLDRHGLEAYSWDAQAATLERVLQSALDPEPVS